MTNENYKFIPKIFCVKNKPTFQPAYIFIRSPKTNTQNCSLFNFPMTGL